MRESWFLDMVANVGKPKIMIPAFVCLLRNAWWSITAFWKRPKELKAGKLKRADSLWTQENKMSSIYPQRPCSYT